MNLLRRIIGKLAREFQIPIIIKTAKSMKNLRLSKDELKTRQDKMLQKIVHHAYNTVPYYRKLFDKNSIKPSDINGLADLYKIPISTKNDLQSADIISSNYDKKDLIERTTGGSSGVHLHIFMDKSAEITRVAEGRRVLYLHGYKATGKHLIISYYGFDSDFINRLGFFRQDSISWDVELDKQVETIQKYKPTLIEGYPSRLGLLAVHIISNEIKINSPKFIITNSEILYPDVRKNIERAFGCRVVNVYDSEEFGQMAWECPKHKGLHVNADTRIIEIVKDGKVRGPGCKGEIVCTDLINYAMPLIRYNIGDIATWSSNKCDCGITYPLLENIEGRQAEYFVMPSGKKLSSTVVYIPPEIPGLVQYQITQVSLTRLDVKIIKARGYTKKEEEQVIKHLVDTTTIKDIRISYVKSIKKTKRAKHRRFIPLKAHK